MGAVQGRTVRRVLRLLPCALVLLAPARLQAAGVVGNGTPGSCTEAALNAALVGGGAVTFNCGASPVVIPITAQKVIAAGTTVDGGSADLVILDAGGATRHFTTNQNIPLTVRNLTLRNGRCPIPDPGQPSPGYGGSIRSGILSPLTVTDTRFINNVCDATGNDVGGGAIRQRRGALVIQRTLFQGNRAGNAGAISSSDSAVVIEDSTFLANTTNAFVGGYSGVGGGFYNDGSGGGQIVIRRTVFQNNTATFRAGALQTFFYPVDQGLLLEDCTFTGNSSVSGPGGLLHQAGPLTMRRSTFTGNTTQGDGGALQLYLSNPTAISDSTFAGNVSNGTGGGLWFVDSSGQVTNSTVSGNSAQGGSGFGGGIAQSLTGSFTLSHVTIADNAAGGAGGGTSGTGMTLRASIVSNNTAPTGRNCQHTMAEGGFNVQFPAQGPNCSSSVLVADPLLGPLASNGGPTQTRALGGASPARNRVTSGCPPPSADQRGVARPQGGACDTGAYEASGSMSVADASLTEGNAGSTNLTFTLTLSEPASQTITAGYATANGTAAAGADYTATSGTVTFTTGMTTRTVNVPVLGDTLDEDDETFTLNLFNPVGAFLTDGQAVGTIVDNDAAPAVSAGDCAVLEGHGGGVGCSFALTLSAASGKTVSVGFATASGSATAGADFAAASGSVAFPPGATSTPVVVSVLGDTVDEMDEAFALNLASPTNATIGDGTGAGTIDDDDGPGVRANDPSVAEGNAGGTPATFTVSLSTTSVQPVVVDYQTSDGTASAGNDYNGASGTLTFTPGQTTRTVSVNVIGDSADEPNERFYLNLLDAVDGSVADPSGTGTIVDDDGGTITLGELGHGAERRGDLATGPDVFLVAQPAFTSWEVVVDGPSGDIGGASGVGLERLADDLATVVQGSTAVGTGPARTLRWEHDSAVADDGYVRVRSTQCSPCGPDDVYRVRAYETTLSIPRFNNAGGQVTVLVLQNPTSRSIDGTLRFWNAAGAALGSSGFALAPRQTLVLNTSGVAGVAGQSGTITIAHTAGYGALAGKTVALDPSGGFSFDTPAVARSR